VRNPCRDPKPHPAIPPINLTTPEEESVAGCGSARKRRRKLAGAAATSMLWRGATSDAGSLARGEADRR
jgi:hypothetical protein